MSPEWQALAHMLGQSPVLALVGFLIWERTKRADPPPPSCPLVSADVRAADVGAAVERVDRALSGIEASLGAIQLTLAELRRLQAAEASRVDHLAGVVGRLPAALREVGEGLAQDRP